MAEGCVALGLVWSSFLYGSILFPDFVVERPLYKLSNLSVSQLQVGSMGSTFNSSLWDVTTGETLNISGTTTIDSFLGTHRVSAVARVEPVAVRLSKKPDDACYSSETSLDQCQLDLRLNNITVSPPDPVMYQILTGYKRQMETELVEWVCGKGIPSVEQQLKNYSTVELRPYPSLVAGATPLSEMLLLTGSIKGLNQATAVKGVRLELRILTDTTLQVALHFYDGFRGVFAAGEAVHPLVQVLLDVASALELEDQVKKIMSMLEVFSDPRLTVDAPAPFSLSLDISAHDLWCQTPAWNCSFPLKGGLSVSNVRLNRAGEWDRLFALYLDTYISKAINKRLANLTNSSDPNATRFFLPQVNPYTIRSVPYTSTLVIITLLCLAAPVVVALLSVRRHKRCPVKTHEGTAVTLRCALAEDMLLTLLLVAALFSLVWYHFTLAALNTLCYDVHVMGFAFILNVQNMWKATMYPYAIIIFALSGLYPYVKLASIVAFTLVLQRPESRAFSLINHLSKFTFLDAFGVILLAAGVRYRNIAIVEHYPGFYAFKLSLILSNLAGNYATRGWRRGTTLRRLPKARRQQHPFGGKEDEQEASAFELVCKGGAAVGEANSQAAVPGGALSSLVDGLLETDDAMQQRKKRLRTYILRSLNGAAVFVCVLLAWVYPCVWYEVRGDLPLFESESYWLSLWDLVHEDWMSAIMCVLTLFVAPVLYALTHPLYPELICWSAADAFLLVCVAAMTHYDTFIASQLGPTISTLYRVKAHLLWPLLPMLFAAIWQWALVLDHGLSIRKRTMQRLRRHRDATSPPRQAQRTENNTRHLTSTV
ncbi:putative Paraquat inducible protein A [Trypanosoma vivax]|nr:hypothetical protein TRVL_03141 [Trypanosoma vivax]KAH8619057.1 putative Paraquat inducible protein A [Trypanosoma vivax]